MSTSDDRQNRRALFRGAALYGAAAAFCILFDNVYALFGHDVRSAAMSRMFFYPLAGAAVILFLGLVWPAIRQARLWPAAKGLFHCGIAVLTMGSLLKGIMDIAGTASPYTIWYTLAGSAAVAAAGLLGVLARIRAG